MSENVEHLGAILDIDVKGYLDGIKGAVQASRDLHGALNKLTQGQVSLQRAVIGTGMAIGGLVVAYKAATALKSLHDRTIDSAVRFDALRRSVVATEGSLQAATDTLVRMEKVAKLPGLGFAQAVSGFNQLRNAGYSAALAERSLRAFGNALALIGRGRGELDGLNRAFTQIVSKGKVHAEEINQIAERLPQIRKLMQDAFGTSDTQTLQRRGMSPLAFLEGLIKQAEKLPQVTGGISLAMENMDEALEQTSRKIGEAFVPAHEALLKAAIPIVETVGNIADAFNKLSPEVKTTMGVVAMVGVTGTIVGGLVLVGKEVLTLARIYKDLKIAADAANAAQAAGGVAGLLGGAGGVLGRGARAVLKSGGRVALPVIAGAAAVGVASYGLSSLQTGLVDRVSAIRGMGIPRHPNNDAPIGNGNDNSMEGFWNSYKDLGGKDVSVLEGNLKRAQAMFQQAQALHKAGKVSTLELAYAQKILNDAIADMANPLKETNDALQKTNELRSKLGLVSLEKGGVSKLAGMQSAYASLSGTLGLGERQTAYKAIEAERQADYTRRTGVQGVFGGEANKQALLDSVIKLDLFNRAIEKSTNHVLALPNAFNTMAAEARRVMDQPLLNSVNTSPFRRENVSLPGNAVTMGAFSQLGITPQSDLRRLVSETRAAYEQIASDTTTHVNDRKAAWMKMIEAHIAAGDKLPPAVRKQYDKMRSDTRSATREISTIITNTAQGIASSMFDGLFARDTRSASLNQSLADQTREYDRYVSDVTARIDKLSRIATRSAQEETTSLRLELQRRTEDHNLAVQRIKEELADTANAWTRLRDTALSSLRYIGQAIVSNVIQKLLESTGVVDKLAGGLAKALSYIPGLGGIFGRSAGTLASTALSSAPIIGAGAMQSGAAAALGIGGSVGGGASSVAGAAASSLMSTVGAIGSIGSMISGIVGNFQFSGMNKSLDVIVQHTLQTTNIVRDTLNTANKWWPFLSTNNDAIWAVRDAVMSLHESFQAPRIAMPTATPNGVSSPNGIALSSPSSISVSLSDVRAQSFMRSLKAFGLRSSTF